MGSHRRTLAAAAATILASVSLYPIFTGTLWFWGGAGAVCVVAVTGTLTRLRRLPPAVCLAAELAGLLLYLNVAYSSARSLLHVLPTPSSLHFLLVLAGEGFDEAARYAPPVPPLWGIVVIAAGGIGIIAAATDLIAVRLESAALAGLPLLALFTEPFTLSVSRGPVGTAIAFCLAAAGYLTLLSSEGRDRIREWEQPAPGPDEIPDTRALAAAGRRVGIASVALALCLPLLIPGLHVTRLFGGGRPGIGGRGGSGAAVVGFPDPDTQLSRELHTSQAAPVFTYRSSDPTPQYFQIYALDKLTSSGWQMFSQPESLVPASPRLPAPPGATNSTWAAKVTTTVRIGPGVGQDALLALPAPYPATAVFAPGSVRADRASLMLFDPGVRLAGLSYTVTSLDEAPPAQALNNAPPPPAGIAGHYLEVPASYDPLRALAQSVVREAGAKTAFQMALALQDWLSGGTFTYTLNAPTVADAAGLRNFLTVTRRGYCQQFSFAMAVLARLLGIPSRVAYGFTAGTASYGGTWLVTTHDAHAWPELYFQGFGWLRFEPTPQGGAAGQGTANAPSYTLEPASAFPQSPQSLSAGLPAGPVGSSGRNPASLGERLGLPLGGAGGAAAVPATATVNPWAVFGLCVLGLLVLTAATPPCARLAVRRRRWRAARRRGDAALAHAAWRELRDDLVDYGAGYLPSESPRALAARAAASLSLAEPAVAALRRITLAEERARYAGRPDSGAGLRHDSAVARRAIAAAVPRRSRWRARLMPPSVLTPALAGLSRVADIFARLNPEWFGGTRLGWSRPRRARLNRAGAAAARGTGAAGGPEPPAMAGAAGSPAGPPSPSGSRRA